MRSASRQLPYADRVVILLAVKFGCNISSDTERRIRTNERARVVDYLQALGICAISRHASYRRTATRPYARALDLVVDVRLDERRLIIRELRREAKISFAHGLDSGALDLAAKQLDNWTCAFRALIHGGLSLGWVSLHEVFRNTLEPGDGANRT